MKTVVQPYDEEVDVTVLEVDMPEPELNVIFVPSAKHLYGR